MQPVKAAESGETPVYSKQLALYYNSPAWLLPLPASTHVVPTNPMLYGLYACCLCCAQLSSSCVTLSDLAGSMMSDSTTVKLQLARRITETGNAEQVAVIRDGSVEPYTYCLKESGKLAINHAYP